MKIQQLFSKNQRGASLPMVMAVVSLGVAGLSYTITDLLPKMQKEKTRVEATINYRVFMASLNDYLVHALRERWCFNVLPSGEPDLHITDLLISDACSDGKPMEEIVTYPGNLERLLWSNKNVEAYPANLDQAKKDNRIMAINFLRFYSTPKLANRLLSKDHIYLPGNALNLRLTRDILDDMNDQHPLFTMTRGIRDCVNFVDIKIFQQRLVGNMATGDEQKIGISITPKINSLKLRCHTIRTAESTSFYTFFPRRLHTFSLIKYGKLEANRNNEFHSPVYVAGDLILPAGATDYLLNKNEPLKPSCFDPDNGKGTSVFYNTLTLGIFNSGDSSRIFRPGKILQNDGQVFSFNSKEFSYKERGHPYASKQDCYSGFRGFLGGVRLDATEDKGFYNLFDHTGTTSANMTSLQDCINETKYQTTPSLHRHSKLVYKKELNTSTEAKVRLALTKFNRFKAGSIPIAENPTPHAGDLLKFIIDPPGDGVPSYGRIFLQPIGQTIGFDKDLKDNFYGTIGGSSTVKISIHLDVLGFEKTTTSPSVPGTLETMITKLDNVDKNSYLNVAPSGHVIKNTLEYIEYEDAAKKLRDKCEVKNSTQCQVALKYAVSTCTPATACDHGVEFNTFNNKRTIFKSYLNGLMAVVNGTDTPLLTITLEDLPNSSNTKTLLNHKQLKLSVNSSWDDFFPLLKMKLPSAKGLQLQFNALHYGADNRSIRLHLEDNNFQLALKPMENGITNYNLNTSWRTADKNDGVDSQDLREIVHLDCPNGMGLADWDTDMSGSSSFSWNYANTPPGAKVDSNDHSTLEQIVFGPDLMEGHLASLTKSIVKKCTVNSNRSIVYGFYVCEELIIESRTEPLHMIGTFIVKKLVQDVNSPMPVSWYSIWDAKAADFILSDLNSGNPQCAAGNVVSKTFYDYLTDSSLPSRLRNCSALNLVNNGPNNFTWTTVDPDIGIAQAGDTMTSQKANRIQKWIIKEESRVEVIK